MAPTYATGDRILAHRTQSMRVGDIVAFVLPDGARDLVDAADRDQILVKRIAAIDGPWLVVHGDAPASFDSTVFGPIRRDLVIGRAVRRLARTPPSQRRSIAAPTEDQ